MCMGIPSSGPSCMRRRWRIFEGKVEGGAIAFGEREKGDWGRKDFDHGFVVSFDILCTMPLI